MHRSVTFALLSLLLLMNPSAAVAQNNVYRDQVEPNWIRNDRMFWYRIDLKEGAREFWLVDAEQGQRSPAFDHALAAQKLSELLGEPVQPERLPVDSLTFPDDSQLIELKGSKGTFVLNPSDNTITRKDGTATSVSARLILPPPPSRSSSEDMELTIQNQLEEPFELFWIDNDRNERSYGPVAAGNLHKQHTFVGHTWLLKKTHR